MERRIAAIALTALMCGGAFSGCKKSSEKGGDSVEGTYHKLSFYADQTALLKDIDKGLKKNIRSRYVFTDFDIELSDGEFVFGQCYIGEPIFYMGTDELNGAGSFEGGDVSYKGSYSIGNDNEIIFEYEGLNYWGNDKAVFLEENDTFENLTENSPNIEKLRDSSLSYEEFSQEKWEYTIYKHKLSMLEMNKTGTYPAYIAPSLSYSYMDVPYSVIPLFILNADEVKEDDSQPVMLKQKGDFLCVDTCGFELDGSYSSGNDFTINYDPMTTMKNYCDDSQGVPDGFEKALARDLKTKDDYNTTVDFSGGEWKWYNCNKVLINSGGYQESEDYPGLISMYVTEDSPDPDSENYIYHMPILFYISDGKIYYPGFVKSE